MVPLSVVVREGAACSGMPRSVFFHPKENDANHPLTLRATNICMGCEVRFECLELAITLDEVNGIWGGMTPRERKEYSDGEK